MENNAYHRILALDERKIDVDSESLNDFNREVESRFRRKQFPEYIQFEEFLQNDHFLRKKGDPDINLFEQGNQYRILCIPPGELDRFWYLYERCRLQKIELNFTERQNPASSGIRIDLDIYQDDSESIVTFDNLTRLCDKIAQVLVDVFPLESAKGYKLFMIVSTRPRITEAQHQGKKCWKNGVHIDIPSLKCSRNAKRLIIKQMQTRRIMTSVFGDKHADAESFLDQNSSFVPLVLYGSCKTGGTTYPITKVRQYNFVARDDWNANDDDKFATFPRINHSLELSVNFTWNPRGEFRDLKLIDKVHFDPREEWAESLFHLDKANQRFSEEERIGMINDLNHLTVNDPDANYLKDILDILKPERYNDRRQWFKVLYALMKYNENYLPLARWFSRKSSKYDDVGFDKAIKEIMSTSKYNINIESIYYWAKKDNPERFQRASEKSCMMLIHKYVFDKITEGKLGHSHYAELLYIFLRNKYVTDFNGGKRSWFEFKFPQDKFEPGQVYKWAPIEAPDSLDTYIHRKLYNLCLKMEEYLEKKKKEATDKILVQYWKKIVANVRGSARGLTMQNFKAGVIRQAETIFAQPGFVKRLNRDTMVMGVGNGVLLLSSDGKPPRLLKSYHSYKVSRYTETPYHPIDPEDPTTIKILRALRSMFPDDEADAFEYMMSYLSATIDNRPREAIMLLATGGGSNGKSVLVSLIQTMLGDTYACSMPFSLLTSSKEDQPEGAKPMLMQLETARLATYSEGSAAAVLFMAMVKRLTGGDPIPARQLHGTAKNIRSRCYHFVMSNHDFIVTTHEEAVWRRLRYIHLKMTFKDEKQYDAENPLHRLMDRSFNNEFIEDMETRSRVLAICTFFHMKLMRYHGGVIDHVPHPTVDASTDRFRNSQDNINRFISERVVVREVDVIPDYSDAKLVDTVDNDDDDKDLQEVRKTVKSQPSQLTSLEDLVDKYCDWYDRNIRQIRHYRSDYHKQFLDSAIKDDIEQTDRGMFLKAGYRVLGQDDIMREGEHVFRRKVKKRVVKESESPFPRYETPDDYIRRFQTECKELFHNQVVDWNRPDTSVTYRYDTDDDQDERLQEEDEPQKPLPYKAPDTTDLGEATTSQRMKKVFRVDSDSDSDDNDELVPQKLLPFDQERKKAEERRQALREKRQARKISQDYEIINPPTSSSDSDNDSPTPRVSKRLLRLSKKWG